MRKLRSDMVSAGRCSTILWKRSL